MGNIGEALVTPHGGQTVDEFRLDRAKWGLKWGRSRHAIIKASMGRPMTPIEIHRFEELVEAGTNAWGVVAALAWVRKEYGEEAAHQMASLLDEVGINGLPWDESLLDIPGLEEARNERQALGLDDFEASGD